MTTEQTQAVLQHHAGALMGGDIDGVMEDYTDESVFVSNDSGVSRGAAAIRAVFATMSPFEDFEVSLAHFDGDVAFVTWKAKGISFGTDTFVINDGKIVLQTVAFHRA